MCIYIYVFLFLKNTGHSRRAPSFSFFVGQRSSQRAQALAQCAPSLMGT